MRKTLTPDIITKVAKLHEKGMTETEICKFIEISAASIGTIRGLCENIKAQKILYATSDKRRTPVLEEVLCGFYGKKYPTDIEPEEKPSIDVKSMRVVNTNDATELVESVDGLKMYFKALILKFDNIIRMQQLQMELLDNVAVEIGCNTIKDKLNNIIQQRYKETKEFGFLGTQWMKNDDRR